MEQTRDESDASSTLTCTASKRQGFQLLSGFPCHTHCDHVCTITIPVYIYERLLCCIVIKQARLLQLRLLFERSEFLIDTSQNEIRPCARVSLCSTNLGFSVTSANGIRPNHGIPLPAYIHIVFENAHTHIATAASETEGVAAVSWIESWIESCV